MARRYSTAAAMTTTMHVESYNPGVDTIGWVSVDGVKRPFAVSGPTNFMVSGRLLSFRIEKVGGTNSLDVSMQWDGQLHDRILAPEWVEGFVSCSNHWKSDLILTRLPPWINSEMRWSP